MRKVAEAVISQYCGNMVNDLSDSIIVSLRVHGRPRKWIEASAACDHSGNVSAYFRFLIQRDRERRMGIPPTDYDSGSRDRPILADCRKLPYLSLNIPAELHAWINSDIAGDCKEFPDLSKYLRHLVQEDMYAGGAGGGNADPERLLAVLETALTGDCATAKVILRECVEATMGLDGLAERLGKHPVSVSKMLGRAGNPRIEDFFAIIAALADDQGVGIEISVRPRRPADPSRKG